MDYYFLFLILSLLRGNLGLLNVLIFCNNNYQESSYFTTATTTASLSSTNNNIHNNFESFVIPYFECRIELMIWMHILSFMCILFISRFLMRNCFCNKLLFIICKRKRKVAHSSKHIILRE